MAKVEIPFGRDGVVADRTLHIDVRLTRLQAMTLRRVRDALDAKGERLPTLAGWQLGRRVATAEDTLRWLLVRIGDAASAAG